MSVIHGAVHTCRDASHACLHETVRSACLLLLTWRVRFSLEPSSVQKQTRKKTSIRRFGHAFSALSIYWVKHHF
ncbi:Uncharacterized protein APZ42_026914 [Daphnia magna]|uniref:Uncharacterized protein n=1 Tax=Daphnia magna TaxID=35525 RepID=A0A0P5UCY0_9CRUS|nr:Uncharacterized protein APZ42_026914 [Daphnia magna]